MAGKSVYILALVCCSIALVAGAVIYDDEALTLDNLNVWVPLSRHARSPDGSVVVEARKDQSGRSASVDYNHQIYKSKDGNFKVDAYGQASRDFDRRRNDYGAGVRGSWRF